jgi:hypothetical protein
VAFWAKQVCYAGDDDSRSPASESNKRSAKNLKLMHECERTLKLARKNLKTQMRRLWDIPKKKKFGPPKLKINAVINFLFPCLKFRRCKLGMSVGNLRYEMRGK